MSYCAYQMYGCNMLTFGLDVISLWSFDLDPPVWFINLTGLLCAGMETAVLAICIWSIAY